MSVAFCFCWQILTTEDAEEHRGNLYRRFSRMCADLNRAYKNPFHR